MKERPLNRIWRDANQFFRSHMKEACMSCPYSRSPIFQALSVLTLGLCSSLAAAATVHNPVCPVESVLYNPGSGEDIVVPTGYIQGQQAEIRGLRAGVGARPAEPL